MQGNKPGRPAGSICPLWRRDVSKVCHKCDWYQSVAVQDHPEVPTMVRAEWGCALVLSVIAQRSMHSAIDGVQAATESFRNEMVRISYQHSANPGRDIAPSEPQRLINGN